MNLRDNLINKLKANPAWLALANAVQAVNDDVVEPTLERLKARPRLFDMRPEDVKVLFDELGSVFAVGDPSVEDRPLLLQQRQDEIRQKTTTYPLEKTLEREYENVSVRWRPLFAPVDLVAHPYGTVLVTEESKDSFGIPDSDWFLTSRGVVEISVSDVYRLYPGSNFEEAVPKIEQDIKRFITPLVPVRIVFDGYSYTLRVDMTDVFDKIINTSSSVIQVMDSFSEKWVARIDKHRIGSVRLDAEPRPNRSPKKTHEFISSGPVAMSTKAGSRFDRERLDAQRVGALVRVQDTRMSSVTRTLHE